MLPKACPARLSLFEEDNEMSGQRAGPEDFKLDKGYEPLASKTLEEVISEGESLEDKDSQSERVTVNNYPQWIRSLLIHLKHKHKHATNVSAIERLVIKLGIAIARQEYGPLVEQIHSLKKTIFESGSQIDLMKAYNTTYQPQETVGKVYHKCSVWDWEIGAITELLVEPLGLSCSAATLITLICGISASTVWVPAPWILLAKKEMANFRQFLEDEVTRLKRLCHSNTS